MSAYGTWLVEQPVPECIIDQTRRHWNPQDSGRVRGRFTARGMQTISWMLGAGLLVGAAVDA